MKREPGVNGDWIERSREERLSSATLSTFVTLGTPAAIQVATSITEADNSSWLLNLAYWLFCVLFWLASTALPLSRRKTWVWSDEALAEQRRYVSDTRVKSTIYWGHWWVRFPVGLLFLSAGIHGLTSVDFNMQWMSLVLLLLAFITPFMFMAELALLPFFIALILALMGLATVLPFSILLILAIAAMVATVLMAQSQRSKLPPEPKNTKPVKNDKTDKIAKTVEDDAASPVMDSAVGSAPDAESAK